MEKDTKLTFTVIVLIIALLGGLSFMLRDDTGNALTPARAPHGENAASVSQTPLSSSTKPMEPTTNIPDTITSATLTTNMGVIEVSFATNAPATVQNFAKLAASGFYDGVRFHRVIKGFMIQAGDPLSKDVANKDRWGTGGPGYTFDDELTGKEQYPQGTLAMANAGPNTNGSQFFIVTANPGAPLPPSYTVFGRVTKGMETALKIEAAQRDSADRPLQDVIIEKVEVR